MKKVAYLLLLLPFLLSSCKSKKSLLSLQPRQVLRVESLGSAYSGIDRVRRYEFTHRDVPAAFDGFHDDIVRQMNRYGMHVLEHKVDTLRRGGEEILIAGVRNPFDLQQNGQSPTLALSPDDFVILLVHTPDYVEDVSVANTDLALAGHTHGGQVRIFDYAPIVPLRYGARFLTGLTYNTAKVPIIVTNGIGTSNKNIRIGAPSEVVVITLHRLE